MDPKTDALAHPSSDSPTRLRFWKQKASDDRAQLRLLYEQAADELHAADLVRLGAYLEEIEPATVIDKAGHRTQVEDRFRLRPKDRRDLAAALLLDGVEEKRIPSLVPLSKSTWWRIRAEYAAGTLQTPLRNGSSKRPKGSNRAGSTNHPNGPLPILRFDATSGVNWTRVAQRKLLQMLGEWPA